MNTDKYEGHTEGPWKWAEHTGAYGCGNQLWGVSIVIDDGWTDCLNCGSTKNSLWDYTSPTDMELIAAAPDLLAEVKRLQKRNEWLEEVVAQAQEHYHIDLSDEGWPRWEEEE